MPRGGEGRAAQAGRVLRHGRARPAAGAERGSAGGLHQYPHGQEGARRRDGVPAHQPSARLSDLRPGRRVRPAGPGDGLRHGRLALPGKQARRRRQVHRPARQDDHEPLHPLHAVRPVHDGGRRHFRARPDRAGRGRRDHDLSRTRHDLRAPGQRHRPLPGRSPDVQALRVPGAALGTGQDGIDRRHGRLRVRDPGRHARQGSHAHHAAGERGGERGVDLRQDPLHMGRPQDPAARQALCEGRRSLPAGELGGGLQGHRRCRQVGIARRHRRGCRRPGDGRGDVRAQGTDDVARFAEHRLPAGPVGPRPGLRARLLSVQSDHRGHRGRRRTPRHRLQPPLRGVGAQRAHPQALAHERSVPDRRDRRKRRPAIRLRLSRGRRRDAHRPDRRQACLPRHAQEGRAPDDRRRAGGAVPPRRPVAAGPCRKARRRGRRHRRRMERVRRDPHGGRARRWPRPGLRAGRGRHDRRENADGRGGALPSRRRRTGHGSADVRLHRLHRHARRRRCAPCGRDPSGGRLHREVGHLREHRGARHNSPTGRASPRETRARTGRSSGRYPTCSATSSRSIRSTRCAPGSTSPIRISPRSTRFAATTSTPYRRVSPSWRKKRASSTTPDLRRRSKTSI